ncbi:MAG: hypothetical protein JWO71_3393 [Candidatus Acidoferrum typicum]|nr:hypothetical protein [Candidatus Acidoferrum typicum]
MIKIIDPSKLAQPTYAHALFFCTLLFTALVISSCARVDANGKAAPAGGPSGSAAANPGTAPGTYTLTITGRCTSCSTKITHETSLILVLQ